MRELAETRFLQLRSRTGYSVDDSRTEVSTETKGSKEKEAGLPSYNQKCRGLNLVSAGKLGCEEEEEDCY